MKKITLSIILLINVYLLSASDLAVKLIKPDTLFIGQPFDIEVKIQQYDKQKILPPKHVDSKVLEIIKSSYVLKNSVYTYTISFAAFDTGRVEVPSLSFYLSNSQSDTDKSAKILDSLQTQTFSVWVTPATVESDTTLKDIKPPLSLYLEWQDYLLIVAVLYALSLIYMLIKKLRNRKNNDILDRIEYDNRPAWQKAYDMLLSLKEKQLLESGEWVEYHYLLSMVLRYFLLMQFNIKAVEMTSYEIKESLTNKFPNKKEIMDILNYSDQIKFAKFIPDTSISKNYEIWVENYLKSFKEEVTEMEQSQ